MTDTVAPACTVAFKSTSTPFNVPANAAFAKREPIDAATSATVDPSGTERADPSGRSTEISAMDSLFYGVGQVDMLSFMRRLSLSHNCSIGGKCFRLLRGIHISVFLPSEFSNFKHQLIGHFAQHKVIVAAFEITLWE